MNSRLPWQREFPLSVSFVIGYTRSHSSGLDTMPIYEYACPACRVIFNFLSKRTKPDRLPVCPKCGNKKMTKLVSRFAMPRGLKEPAAQTDAPDDATPDFDDPRVERTMMELDRDMEHMDENNPKHMAHMMRKMK